MLHKIANRVIKQLNIAEQIDLIIKLLSWQIFQKIYKITKESTHEVEKINFVELNKINLNRRKLLKRIIFCLDKSLLAKSIFTKLWIWKLETFWWEPWGEMSVQVCQSLGGDSFIQIDVVNSASASTAGYSLILFLHRLGQCDERWERVTEFVACRRK